MTFSRTCMEEMESLVLHGSRGTTRLFDKAIRVITRSKPRAVVNTLYNAYELRLKVISQ